MDFPKRSPNRLRGYDYSRNGAYFLTFCTYKRQELLCTIHKEEIILLPIGIICETQINELPDRFNMEIDKYVIMPNHIHMIVNIDREEQNPYATTGDILCAFKSLTAKIANTNDGIPGRIIWQRSFHDRIIRNEIEYQKIWQYIDTNQLKWEDDCFYGNKLNNLI